MMKKPFCGCLIVLIACLALTRFAPVWADPPESELVTADEAFAVAQNWVTLIVHLKGSWGGTAAAQVLGVEEFRRGDRSLGYYCPVAPQGFVIVTLRRELAPVKAYSEASDLEPTSVQGMADLLKIGLEQTLDTIEVQVGAVATARPEDVARLVESPGYEAWHALSLDPTEFRRSLAGRSLETAVLLENYQEGEWLLTTSWDQKDPFWELTPMGDGGQCLVGCNALAAAQVLAHWDWPPAGVGIHMYFWDGDDSCGGLVGGGMLTANYNDAYDWARMVDRYRDDGAGGWQDQDGNPLTQAHVDAVAELCYEAGVASSMDYGHCASGTPTHAFEGVYESYYRYSTACTRRNHVDYTASEWFDRIKAQINLNRPILYHIKGHGIVADGWEEVASMKWYHFNYGWDNHRTTWYELDQLHQVDPAGGPDDEYMLENIVPAPSLGSSLAGLYFTVPPTYPFYYFDQDAAGDSATFLAGHGLQFLPGITVRCRSGTGDAIRFRGPDTLLFTRGDQTRGIRIFDGTVRLNQGGSLRFQ
jgi:hypothetical protein